MYACPLTTPQTACHGKFDDTLNEVGGGGGGQDS